MEKLPNPLPKAFKPAREIRGSSADLHAYASRVTRCFGVKAKRWRVMLCVITVLFKEATKDRQVPFNADHVLAGLSSNSIPGGGWSIGAPLKW
jgi:hypothetical protein